MQSESLPYSSKSSSGAEPPVDNSPYRQSTNNSSISQAPTTTADSSPAYTSQTSLLPKQTQHSREVPNTTSVSDTTPVEGSGGGASTTKEKLKHIGNEVLQFTWFAKTEDKGQQRREAGAFMR